MIASERHRLGHLAETWVAERLEALGWVVHARCHRGRCGEIDLIARHEGCWIFVEVKFSLRRPAVEALGWRQQARIRRAAGEWLARRGSVDVAMRFDLVLVWGDPFRATHLPDAF